MPYKSISELPPPVKDNLPTHAEEIYMAAYNSAWEQHGKEDNAEIICNKIAWDAVKRSYRKNPEGQWVAKEANMKLSAKNKQNLLQTALVQEYHIGQSTPIPKSLTIEEVFDDKVIYDVDGQLYEASYELGENGEPTFGEATKVVATKVFKAMESLQSTYSEIIQEAGRRNAVKDAARLKKIVELCQELLSSDVEPEEEKAKETLKEATAVLAMLKIQEAVKTEDSIQFPSQAFAYVPDVETPSGWKLRLWEDLEKKITRAQLGRAAAALSPGGFRGQKVAIPSADLSAVKRKIRAEYRKLDVDEEDISPWVKEIETREPIANYIPLTEAKFDKGRATIKVIEPGFNVSEDRYYPAEMLKRDYKVFEGMKMYADHPTEEEDNARPERSIRDWVATLVEVHCDENGVVTGIAEIVEPWLMQKLASLRDKDMLSEMGISINAIGSASKGTIDGKETLVIEKLVACRSVDFVTEPGAGGIVTMYESDRSHDVDLVELSGLRERRPDLIKIIEANVRAEITREVKLSMEDKERITELEGQVATLTTERDGLQTKVTEGEKAQARAEAQAAVKEAVDKAELPEASKTRLMERFKDAESAEGIEAAIKSEIDYIAELSESVKVKGLGQSKPDPEKDKTALKESFKKLHPEWSDEQLETAATGR